MIYADEGRMLKVVSHFFDTQQTAYVRRVYEKTGYPVGHELRGLARVMGGDFDFMHRPNNQYDTLNMPFAEGTLVIERPWMDLQERTRNGHRISFVGRAPVSLHDDLAAFLDDLHTLQRRISRSWFLRCTDRYSPEEALEVAKLFE